MANRFTSDAGVAHLRRFGLFFRFSTQRLRTGLTCGAPLALGSDFLREDAPVIYVP